jgi:hypothetical protein
MKRGALTPLEALAEQRAPNRVDYQAEIVWLDGQVTNVIGVKLTLLEAAESLEVLADELRAAHAAAAPGGNQQEGKS